MNLENALHFQVFANAIILHVINRHLHLVTVSLTVSFNVIPNDDCQILKYGTLDPPNKKSIFISDKDHLYFEFIM